ncbi:radical SAM/SPASM domain-containing protein [Marinifilum fragile]|uniref:radical SAM/SPASM domain-containing protein n=1 Tax=Marinifilum fragile TaxID=570161 RepID=UPI0006D13F07|nr:radical SAM/SPASM domain-containing protein [Marinifilum fragile]
MDKIRIKKEFFGAIGIDPTDRIPFYIENQDLKHLDDVNFELINRERPNEYSSPIYLTVFTTMSCNKNCEFCCYKEKLSEKDQTLSLSLANKIIELEKNYNILLLNILGGEPIQEHSWEITHLLIESFLEKNICVNLTTNGLNLHKFKGDIDNLFQTYGALFQLRISINLDGGIGEKKSIKRLFETLSNSIFPIHINTVATQDNYESYTHFFDFVTKAVQRDIKSWSILFPKVNPPLIDLKSYNAICKKLELKYSSLITFNSENFTANSTTGTIEDYSTGCGIGKRTLSILPNGDIYPCRNFIVNNEFKIGTVNDDYSLIWEKAILFREKTLKKIMIDKCNEECKFINLCKPCPSDIYNNTYPLCNFSN